MNPESLIINIELAMITIQNQYSMVAFPLSMALGGFTIGCLLGGNGTRGTMSCRMKGIFSGESYHDMRGVKAIDVFALFIVPNSRRFERHQGDQCDDDHVKKPGCKFNMIK